MWQSPNAKPLPCAPLRNDLMECKNEMNVLNPELTETLPNIYIQNVVSTFNLGCKLDLKKIATQARNAEYNPKRFSAVIMRIRNPKSTALIFSSGKVNVTGARSEQQSLVAARKYARIIQRLGFAVEFKDFTIQNVVSSVDVKFSIRLEGLAFSHANNASYEPEIFPGLIYRMRDPVKMTLLVFVSGKVVITGGKTTSQIKAAFAKLSPTLVKNRKSF